MPPPPSRPRISSWVVALGATGFAAGFLGPIVLNPEANQGPLLGLFITGPGGALGGLVLGFVAALLPISNAVRRTMLTATCTACALVTLFFCLPQPAVLGYVIDAEVVECAAPRELADDATTTWQAAVDRTTWHTPPADWKQIAARNLNEASGRVLTMHVARRAVIHQHRKPWSFGRKTAGAWQSVSAPERYYVDEPGSDCARYLARPRQLYMPFVSPASPSDETARVWPPMDVTSFLRLMEIGPVPDEYQRLLPTI